MTSTAGRIRRLLSAGRRGGWRRITRTAWVAWRVERSLAHETLDRSARRFGAILATEAPRPGAGAPVLDDRERLALTVAARVLERGPFDASCLRRALVFADVLRARAPRLRVGVAKNGELVTAHAWLEIDGASLDPMALERFSALRPVEAAAA